MVNLPWLLIVIFVTSFDVGIPRQADGKSINDAMYEYNRPYLAQRSNVHLTTTRFYSGPTSDQDSNLEYFVRVRGWKEGGPCAKSDRECMSLKMLEYVNEYRKKKNLKELGPGTVNQLKNAVNHCKAMQARGKIYHQDLPAVNLGCNTWFAGENVAVNHPLLSDKPTDPARMCVDQFIESPPHRANLENKNFETVVLGVTVGDDGYFWCTQTFAQRTNFGSQGCEELGVDDENENKDIVSGGHSFKIRAFDAKFGKNKKGKFRLKCQNSKCKFCLTYKSKNVVCLRVKDGVKIDKAVSTKR